MNKKWVVLCSTAVAAVYAAGYMSTATEASKLQQHPQVNIAAADGTSSSMYKDGVYTGTGRNRRGSIQVTVTIKSDKISDVEVSDFAMHYSEDDIVGMPEEVVSNQSAQVQNVSGATYSTEAFEDAVQDALSQALNG